jgi:hypothetical protein
MAAIPILIWMAVIFYKIKNPKFLKLKTFVLCSTFIGLSIFQGAVKLIDLILVKGKPSFVAQTIFIFDLVGISLLKSEIVLPSYLNRPENPWALVDMKKIYDPATSDPLFQGKKPPRRFILSKNRSEINELMGYWYKAITSNFKFYLIHRWNNFKHLVALSRPTVCRPLGIGLPYEPLKKNWLNSHVVFFLKDIQNTIFFRGWVYLLVGGFCLVYSLWTKFNEVIFLSLSGLLYACFYFLISPSCDFRYLWWTVLCSLLSLLSLTSQLYYSRQQ